MTIRATAASCTRRGIGLASSLLLSFSSILSVGYWTLAWTTAAFTPALSVVGSTTGNPRVIDLAGKLATPPWNFIIGVVAIATVSYMMALGMRKLMRFQNILYIIAMVGLVVMAVVLIATPRGLHRPLQRVRQPHHPAGGHLPLLHRRGRRQGRDGTPQSASPARCPSSPRS